ncbi:unnamed protein product [Blepharisma stoltei]|uniref:E3 ubiquitin-protein ligase RNF170 n=1 Tax=Blepharisma stoltei TaxID=1481888 RepID=A0AAU9IH90_9CILI|nr:unnamed protein product [Blepharisma stoltei]
MHHYVAAAIVVIFIFVASYLLKPKIIVDPRRPERVYRSDECLLCLDRVNNPVQTSCGHEYCGQCIIQVWKHDRSLSCPACRTSVHLLFPDFQETEETKELMKEINTFNSDRYPRTIWQTIVEAPTLLLRFIISGDFLRIFRFWKVILLVAFCVVYVMLPEDIINEAEVGPIGSIDDLVVAILSLLCASISYYNRIRRLSADRLVAN